jgi:nucleoside-diphosphate-sugar epimerase
MSGATLYAADEIANSRFGQPSQLILDDVKDRETILSIIRKLPTRPVDNLVIEQPPDEIKTALVVGPLIYGTGRGPCNTRSIQADEIAKATLELGHGFKLNEGENIWSNIHVADLGHFIAQLVEAANRGKVGIWNTDGVYNVAVSEMVRIAPWISCKISLLIDALQSFGELSTRIAEEAARQGLIKADQALETIDTRRADTLSGHASILWGTNARTRSSRAQKLLGWKPSAPSLGETIASIVRNEAASLKA